jgi:hypothetical protein
MEPSVHWNGNRTTHEGCQLGDTGVTCVDADLAG